ncbi:FAD-dependent oxidoreductase [Sphingomicrobium astaxanthinifaciens]|uniref:FAD-dependent oxidoreductase n=1 Tax=Sphingomicrobium astaxanthinifaciens TaxID=1227949 RepID=UPI001FCC0E55|nr:FAD-dependent oxidoreductase [Sphingomicrobium astaxanthinifaciens]MCJ7421407.1 FAD-dependent oxidoreductase [Sphingomicrobium astaxanthinifaciens]
MRHFAIVGSGPAGFYTAEALAKAYGDAARIDIIDRLPVPYGLIRFGVAPDHQSIKKVALRYDKVAEADNVRFVGNVSIGDAVSVAELRSLYDAVIMATGAPHDRRLGIEGEELPGVLGSAEFVGWYNGHPDHAGHAPPLDGEHAVVIGAGNVALDVARILSKTLDELEGSDIVAHAYDALAASRVRDVTILARRGPHQIAMTPKELGELGHLEIACPEVDAAEFPPPEADDALEDRGLAKSVGLLRDYAGQPCDKERAIRFDFFARPVRIEGAGKVERVIVERTRIDDTGRARGTGEEYELPASLVVSCIGYSSPPIEGVAYDHRGGRFANEGGVIEEGLYAVGWARRGPTGTIGTNRPDGYEVAGLIEAAMAPGSEGGKAGGEGLDALLDARDVHATGFSDWRKIEAAEEAAARAGAPREKMVSTSEMLRLLGHE